MAPGGAAAASASARILSLYSAVKVRRLASATTSGSGRGGLGGSGVTVLPAAVLRSFSLRSSSLRSAAGKTVGEAEDIPLFFTLIPVLALLSNYDRENCLINVGTEGQKESAKQLGVDASTLARWERAEREPAGAFLGPVTRFLNKVEAVSSEGAVQVARLVPARTSPP